LATLTLIRARLLAEIDLGDRFGGFQFGRFHFCCFLAHAFGGHCRHSGNQHHAGQKCCQPTMPDGAFH
jgi:hypothetical protein